MEQLSVKDIKLLIQNSPDFTVKCLLTIYDNQTQDEKYSEDTHELNAIGFSGADANILSSFAKQVIRWKSIPEPQYKFPLSPKQLEIAQKKLPKYARQLSQFLTPEKSSGEISLQIQVVD